MKLTTLLEMLDKGQDEYAGDEFAQPVTPTPAAAEPVDLPADDTQEVTGYEISDEDWAALTTIKDGRSNLLSDETIQWLETCGLVKGNPPVLTELAIEWMAWRE